MDSDQQTPTGGDAGSPRRWPVVPLHPVMEDFIAAEALRGQPLTAENRRTCFRDFGPWLTAQGIDPLRATTAQLQAYQHHLANTYRTADGRPLCRVSQASRLNGVKAFYRWLEARGRIIIDPARPLRLRVPKSRVVVREPLTLQEATAIIQTQAQEVVARVRGSRLWAVALRDLAMLCLALATGRRRSGLVNLQVAHVDCDEREVRIEREKSQVGRVLPAASWAMDVVRIYLREARPRLVTDPATPWLFVHRDGVQPICNNALCYALHQILARTIAANPDLDELPGKRVTWHTFRVSMATLLFANGCNIRSINELLLHRLLSTTAMYTPLGVDDLRQALKQGHPRVRGC